MPATASTPGRPSAPLCRPRRRAARGRGAGETNEVGRCAALIGASCSWPRPLAQRCARSSSAAARGSSCAGTPTATWGPGASGAIRVAGAARPSSAARRRRRGGRRRGCDPQPPDPHDRGGTPHAALHVWPDQRWRLSSWRPPSRWWGRAGGGRPVRRRRLARGAAGRTGRGSRDRGLPLHRHAAPARGRAPAGGAAPARAGERATPRPHRGLRMEPETMDRAASGSICGRPGAMRRSPPPGTTGAGRVDGW
jgi:hypothetical protein